jgi:competence protein ComEC
LNCAYKTLLYDTVLNASNTSTKFRLRVCLGYVHSMTGIPIWGSALAWLLGVALHLLQPLLMGQFVYAAGVFTALLLWAVSRSGKRRGWLFYVAALALAWSLSGLRAGARLSDALPVSLENEDVVVTGVVAGLPQRGPQGVRFVLDVQSAQRDGQVVAVPGKISLGWFAGFYGKPIELAGNLPDLRAGQLWRMAVRLRQPHGNANPYGFDYELNLFEQGIRATGSVRTKGAVLPVMLQGDAGHYGVQRLRQTVRDAIGVQVPDARAAGVLSALAIGDQSAIDNEDWQVFRATGVSHLMSISGLHVTMFAWLASLVLLYLWRRSSRLMLLLPAQHAARWGGVMAAFAYAVFSGWGVPAQRTVCMLAIVALLQTLSRRWPWPGVLLVSAVAVTALDPWALMQPGFWLSFMAVGLLLACGAVHAPSAPKEPIAGWLGKWRDVREALAAGLRTQVVTTLGLAPLTLLCFSQISLVGFFANLVAIALVTLVVTPLALLGVLWPALWTFGALIVHYFVLTLQWLGSSTSAVWNVAVAPWWAQLAGLLAAAALLLPWPWRLRAAGFVLVVPMLVPPVLRPKEGQFEALAVDVGQGTSVLVRTRHHLLVFDAGPQYSLDNDAGQRILVPLLHGRGEHRIDRLVLSHRDTDHVGGASALLKAFPVTDMLSSLEAGHPLLAKAAQNIRCNQGQTWQWDGVQFDILHPMAADYNPSTKSNALSCVLRVSAQQGSLLLTGDIERAQEARLVASQALLQSDVLLVPHHGSKTSSTADFLDAVGAKVAIIQAGYLNRYGHPVAQVLERMHTRQIKIHQTVSCGAWHWRSGEAFEGQCQRQRVMRYWQHHFTN